MRGYNHDFCKNEIEISFAEGLDMHAAVEAVHQIRPMAQAVARARDIPTWIRGGVEAHAGESPWAVGKPQSN
jgi:hypothetical protein